MKKITLTYNQLAILSDFLGKVTPQHVVQSLPHLAFKGVVRIENALGSVVEAMAPFSKAVREAEEAIVAKKKESPDMTEQEQIAFEESLEFSKLAKENVEFELSDDKVEEVGMVLERVGFNYFLNKKDYIALCKAFGLTE